MRASFRANKVRPTYDGGLPSNLEELPILPYRRFDVEALRPKRVVPEMAHVGPVPHDAALHRVGELEHVAEVRALLTHHDVLSIRCKWVTTWVHCRSSRAALPCYSVPERETARQSRLGGAYRTLLYFVPCRFPFFYATDYGTAKGKNGPYMFRTNTDRSMVRLDKMSRSVPCRGERHGKRPLCQPFSFPCRTLRDGKRYGGKRLSTERSTIRRGLR